VGGVHCYQVRKSKTGGWQKPILQANGLYEASGPVHAISEADENSSNHLGVQIDVHLSLG
jgi:hypothetical protein